MMLIQRGRVTVNGQLQTRTRWLDPGDVVAVNGHNVVDLKNVAFVAHKPAVCTLTEEDPLRRPTYRSLLPDMSLSFVARPAGCVDIGASGLLVLTCCRALAESATSSPRHIIKWIAQLRNQLTTSQLLALRDPSLFQGNVAPIAIETSDVADAYTQEPGVVRQLLYLELQGGTGHASQLRSALASIGSVPAASICCVGLGPLSLDEPALEEPGSVRPMASAEVASMIGNATGL